MKLFLISTGIFLSTLAVAQNSTPEAEDQKPSSVENQGSAKNEEGSQPSAAPGSTESQGQIKEQPSEPELKKETKKPSNKKSDGDKSEIKNANQDAGDSEKNASQEEASHSPYGASYSFGLTRLNEGSLNLNSSGFARIEVHRKMTQRLWTFERLEMGLNYSGSDIGGNMGQNGAYRGVANFYGARFSAFTKPMGSWFFQYTAGFDIAKIKKIPAFSFINAKTSVSYTPALSIGGAAHYFLFRGLAIGPRLDLSLGGVTGVNFGFQARLAY